MFYPFVLILLGIFLMVVGIVWLPRKSEKSMPRRGWLYWVPRVLCIAYAAIVCVAAAEEFAEGPSFWSELAAAPLFVLLMLVLPVVVPIFWRWDWIGGVYFVALALMFVASEWSHLLDNWWLFKAPSITLLLIPAILFLLNWKHRDSRKNNPIG